MIKTKQLLDQAKKLPDKPGCYLMKNVKDEVLYIGKAKKLKDRVSSYFRKSDQSVKTQYLVSHIDHFDFVVTENEVESLILENNLIKQYTPKYNIRLKDDKTYPYLSYNELDDFPRLIYTRKISKKKGNVYLGPFPDAGRIKSVMSSLQKFYQLRDCTDYDFKNRDQACLLYQINQCSAPCVIKDQQVEYAQVFTKVSGFFKNKKNASEVLKDIQIEMDKAAGDLNYELAAYYRDLFLPVEEYLNFHLEQSVENLEEKKALDIISWNYQEEQLDLVIFNIRNSILIGSKSFYFYIDANDFKVNTESTLTNLISQYYSKKEKIPEMIYSNCEKIDLVKIGQYIEQKFNTALSIKPRNKAKLKKLVELAKQNAIENFNYRHKQLLNPLKGLKKLQEILELKRLPQILECYDIAVWNGKSPTAAQIVFNQGRPDKDRYRYYHLQERPEGNNDFAMLEEVITRRIKSGYLPDILVIDGGKGQVSTVQKVLDKEDISLSIIGLAKSRSKNKEGKAMKTEERIVLSSGKIIKLDQFPHLKHVLAYMRDEAHRFSRRLHHKAENKRFFNKK